MSLPRPRPSAFECSPLPNAARTSSKPPWHIAPLVEVALLYAVLPRPTLCWPHLPNVARAGSSAIDHTGAASSSFCGAATAAPQFSHQTDRQRAEFNDAILSIRIHKIQTCMSTGPTVYSGANASKTRRSPWLHGNTCPTPGALRHSPNLGGSTVEVHGAAR